MPTVLKVQMKVLAEATRNLTLNPGLHALEAYRSAIIPSNVLAVGKNAKKFGCCQCVRPKEEV